MNHKRFWLTAVVVFIFIFFYEWLCHGVLLAGLYQQTPTIWRTEAAMEHVFWSLVIGQALLALMVTGVYARCPRGGVKGGVCTGFGVGLLLAVPSAFMWYSVLPICGLLAFLWAVIGTIEFTLVGLIAALLYKPKA